MHICQKSMFTSKYHAVCAEGEPSSEGLKNGRMEYGTMFDIMYSFMAPSELSGLYGSSKVFGEEVQLLQ